MEEIFMGLLALALDVASVPVISWFLVRQLGVGDVHRPRSGFALCVLVCLACSISKVPFSSAEEKELGGQTTKER